MQRGIWILLELRREKIRDSYKHEGREKKNKRMRKKKKRKREKREWEREIVPGERSK